MRRNIRLCMPATVHILILLASQGIGMSQERSKLVDTGVIFSAQQVERSRNVNRLQAMGLTPPYWTPSPEEIALLEGQLKPYLEGVATRQAKEIAASLESYRRQYVGYTDGGKRWILVNGFCDAYWKEYDFIWREMVIIMLDGGLCFFKARYDPSISQFDKLIINGPT